MYTYKEYVGNGFCNDDNNNQGCNFDGGDCCGPNIDKRYCTECQCLEDVNATTLAPVCTGLPNYVGDGFCDDENNNHECNFDGGDCCGPNVDTIYCIECQCFENFTTTTSAPFCLYQSIIWNDMCDDIANTESARRNMTPKISKII